MPEIRPLFCATFSHATLRIRGNTILGIKFCEVWGPVSRQPPAANPFSKTSDISNALSFPIMRITHALFPLERTPLKWHPKGPPLFNAKSICESIARSFFLLFEEGKEDGGGGSKALGAEGVWSVFDFWGSFPMESDSSHPQSRVLKILIRFPLENAH